MRLLLLAAMLVLCGCGAVYTHIVEERYPPEGTFIELGDNRIHYLQRGSGRDILFIHGNNGSTRDISMSPVFAPLTERFRVTAIDRPGYGYSSRKGVYPRSLRQQAEVVEQFIKRKKLEHPILLAHSVGGAVALSHALIYPHSASALVLLSPVAYPWPGTRVYLPQRIVQIPLLGNIFQQTFFVPIACLARSAAMQETFGPNEVPQSYAKSVGALAMRPERYAVTARDQTLLWNGVAEQSPSYSEIDIPVRIVAGTADTTVWTEIHSKALARTLPHVELRVLDGVAHQPHHTRPGEVLNAVDSLTQAKSVRN